MSRILDYSLRRIKIIPRTDEYLEKYNVIVSRIIASVPPPASLPTAGTLGRHGPGPGPDGPFSLFLGALRIISSIPENHLQQLQEQLGREKNREGEDGFCFRLRPTMRCWSWSAPLCDYFSATTEIQTRASVHCCLNKLVEGASCGSLYLLAYNWAIDRLSQAR